MRPPPAASSSTPRPLAISPPWKWCCRRRPAPWNPRDEGSAVGRGSGDLLQRPWRQGRCRARRLLPRARGRLGRHRGRIRFRQIGPQPGDHGDPAARGHHPQRQGAVQRPGGQGQDRRHRGLAPGCPRYARHPRRAHLHHLPGADDLAVADPHHRRPDRRGAAPPSQGGCGDRARAGDRNAPAGGLSRSREGAAHLSVRAVGRAAPAGDDRHGAGLPAGAADRRRADHGARRHDPGPDPEADQGSPGRARHGAADHHPRPGRRRQHGRRGRGHVPRQGDGERHARRHLPPSNPPLSQGPAARRAALRHGARRAPDPLARDSAAHGAHDRRAPALAGGGGCRRAAASGERHHQALPRPQRERPRRYDRGGGRCELRDQARRVPGPGGRERLRQDHPLQGDHARADARQRQDPVQRSRQDRRCAGA